MKKLLFVSLFLFSSWIMHSQVNFKYSSLEKFLIEKSLNKKYELVKFETLPLVRDDNVKKPLVQKLQNFTHFDHLVEEYDYFKENFMTVDLNGDNKLDIFYSGFLGGASDCYSYIFINESNKFKQEFIGEVGHFSFAVKENGVLKGLIYCYDGFAADCPEISNIELITFNGTDHVSENLINYPNDTKIPSSFFDKPISFVVENEKYYLRSQPEIFNTDFGCGIKGNIHYTYTKGDKGKAFSSETDETGRIWWYVIMENGYAGWMSSRFVKQL